MSPTFPCTFPWVLPIVKAQANIIMNLDIFGNVPHPWAFLPTIMPKANIVVNLNI
jgi:hypothetical protein